MDVHDVAGGIEKKWLRCRCIADTRAAILSPDIACAGCFAEILAAVLVLAGTLVDAKDVAGRTECFGSDACT